MNGRSLFLGFAAGGVMVAGLNLAIDDAQPHVIGAYAVPTGVITVYRDATARYQPDLCWTEHKTNGDPDERICGRPELKPANATDVEYETE